MEPALLERQSLRNSKALSDPVPMFWDTLAAVQMTDHRKMDYLFWVTEAHFAI